MGDETPNFNLYRPSESEDGWAQEVNDNFTTIDSTLRTDEAVQDIVGNLIQANGNISVTYDDGNDVLTVDTSALNTGEVEDAVAALVTEGNAISVNYDDSNDALSIGVDESALSFYDGTNLTADVDNQSVSTDSATVGDKTEELVEKREISTTTSEVIALDEVLDESTGTEILVGFWMYTSEPNFVRLRLNENNGQNYDYVTQSASGNAGTTGATEFQLADTSGARSFFGHYRISRPRGRTAIVGDGRVDNLGNGQEVLVNGEFDVITPVSSVEILFDSTLGSGLIEVRRVSR